MTISSSLIHRLTCISLQHEFLLFHNYDPSLLYGDNNRDSMFGFLGVVNERNRKTLTFGHAIQNAKILNILSSVQV